MSFIIFLLVLGLLIFIHELGHFIAAKKSGVRVYEFALGFPPNISKIKKGETEYAINALPIGGYVRLQGENGVEEDVTEEEKNKSFAFKGSLTKTFILAAGVIMNMILAWVLLSIAFMVGYPTADQDINEQYVVDEGVIITQVLPDSPAEKAEVLPGDELISISDGSNTEEITNAQNISSFIEGTDSENITLLISRSGEEREIDISPTTNLEGEEKDKRMIGIASSNISVVKYPPHLALYNGAIWTGNATVMTVQGLGSLIAGLFQGEGDLSNVAGPIGIVSLVGDAYAVGFVYLLSFTAIISINLAIINLLPVPALDGGRILFVWIEALKGSPMSPRTQMIANGIGFALLILLIIVVSVNDIRNLFM
ncbi:MAG: RIP metalloprotease RseP [Candidatus Campbellbacteria bacterium]|nr:RIP metalloprotease RseP [Candidatus Campbellbacteria bacterium]